MKSKIAKGLLLIALAYPTSRATAAEMPHALTFNASTGGFTFAKTDQLRTQPVFDLRLGYDIIGNNVTDSIGIEGGVSYVSTQSKIDNSPVNAYLFRVDAIFPFFPRSRVVPFFTVGAGGMFMDRGTTLDKAPVLSYGVGIKYFIQEFIALRADLRQNLLFDLATRNDYQYTVGLSFLLDRDKKVKRIPTPPPPVAPKPKTILPAAPAVPAIEPEQKPTPPAPAVEPVPSPPEQPAPANEPEAKQPELQVPLPLLAAAPIVLALQAAKAPAIANAETPKGSALRAKLARKTKAPAKPSSAAIRPAMVPPALAPLAKLPEEAPQQPPVEQPQAEQPRVEQPAVRPQTEELRAERHEDISSRAEGKESLAPLDQSLDADVVASILCPDEPPAGSAPRTLAKESVTVLFDSGSAAVKKEYLPRLKKIAAYIKKYPMESLYIEGHADNKGTPEFNHRLSVKRVENLKKSLSKGFGLTKTRIVTKAFGCRIPIGSNKVNNGRAKNRRATVEVAQPQQ